MRKQKIEVIIEKGDGELYGRIEGKGNYLPVTSAKTTGKVLANLKMLIKDYKKHDKDKFWDKVDLAIVVFELRYDLQAFFQEHDYLKQTKIAELAGINASLVRQYASGVKHPSGEQAKKIENAIHKLAKELQSVSIYAA